MRTQSCLCWVLILILPSPGIRRRLVLTRLLVKVMQPSGSGASQPNTPPQTAGPSAWHNSHPRTSPTHILRVLFLGALLVGVCSGSSTPMDRSPLCTRRAHPIKHAKKTTARFRTRRRSRAGAAVAHLINSSPINPDHLVSANSQPTHLVAYKETREGLYGPYEVEVTEKAPEVREKGDRPIGGVFQEKMYIAALDIFFGVLAHRCKPVLVAAI